MALITQQLRIFTQKLLHVRVGAKEVFFSGQIVWPGLLLSGIQCTVPAHDCLLF